GHRRLSNALDPANPVAHFPDVQVVDKRARLVLAPPRRVWRFCRLGHRRSVDARKLLVRIRLRQPRSLGRIFRWSIVRWPILRRNVVALSNGRTHGAPRGTLLTRY